MKIKGAITNYDYGFGIDQNVFGCLAETYALSIDKQGILVPTTGDVDLAELWKAVSFYKSNGIEVGDFKMGNKIIEDGVIASFLKARSEIIGNLKAYRS